MTARRGPRHERSVLERLADATERQNWLEWAALFTPDATVTLPPADPIDAGAAADLARSVAAAGVTVRYDVIADSAASEIETRRHRATFTSRTGSVTVEATAAARLRDGLIAQLVEHVDLGPVIDLVASSIAERQPGPGELQAPDPDRHRPSSPPRTQEVPDMTDIAMTIDGCAVTATSTAPVVNPATGRPWTRVPECSLEQLDDAFAAAAAAQPAWASDEAARRDALRACAKRLYEAPESLAVTLTTEQGRPLPKATEEIVGAGAWVDYHADLDLPYEVIQDDDAAFVEVVRRPLGVVAAITPWNYPLILACWKIAPALLAGNTVVLKPSPYTPASTLQMVGLLNEVLPPGVLNAVSGGDDLGQAMTAHPVPRKVSFTGSVTAGKNVAVSAAHDLKRVTLELGGNDAAIVLDDVDVEAIADGLFWGAFTNSGQVCSAIKRVFVPEHLEARVVDALADRARTVVVSDGLDPASELGPVNNLPQLERVQDLVADALGRGARAVTGGQALERDGYFFETTILSGLGPGSRIVDEEQFGPALPVLTYRSVEEAVAAANATTFGLSGSVWSADVERAAEVAAQLEVGTAWANAHLATAPHQPFGGFKWSGLGTENGPWGLATFSEPQVRYRSRGAR